MEFSPKTCYYHIEFHKGTSLWDRFNAIEKLDYVGLFYYEDLV